MRPGGVIRYIESKLRLKIIAWSFIPTAIILFLVALTVYLAYQQTARDLILKRDEELTRLTASQVSTVFEDFIDRLNSLARMPGIVAADPDSIQLALESFSRQVIFYDAGVYVLNNLGIVTGAKPEWPGLVGKDWSSRAFFTEMVRTPSLVITDVERFNLNGDQVIVIATPIFGANDEFKGVVCGMFRLDPKAISPFYGALIKMRIGRNGDAYLVDGNGLVVYATDTSMTGRRYPDKAIAGQVLNGGTGVFVSRNDQGASIVTGYAPVPRTHWTLILQEDWNTLAKSGSLYREFLWLLLLLGLGIPTLVVMVGVKRITGPINDFIEAANRIANGDFTHRIKVETGDELEELAGQFNQMAARLDELYDTLEMRVRQRTSELTAVNAIAAVVSGSLDLDTILPNALKKTMEVMGMEGGGVHLLDPANNMLTLAAHQGISDAMVNMIKKMPLDYSIIREVVEAKKPVARLVENYPPGFVRDTLLKEGWVVVVSIPLLAQERVLGAMNIASRDPTPPRLEDLAVPATIGQQIGVALDNVHLYQQTLEYARQAEQARQVAEAARAQAEAANAAKSDFLANVSHELRTPLVSIFGFARIIQKRLTERIFPLLPSDEGKVQRAESQVEENLEIILSEGQRLMSLINNLLDFEKNESGKMDWHPRPVDMGEILKHAAASTGGMFEGKPLSLAVDAPENLPIITGDPDRLRQVLINLVSNAVKFTPRGTIRVSAAHKGDEVVVAVADEGIGIAPEDQARVFEKFSQVGDPLTSKPKGTGLGLAISRQIIDRHGGRIWLESTPGRGSTFYFSLPVADAHATDPTIRLNTVAQGESK